MQSLIFKKEQKLKKGKNHKKMTKLEVKLK